MWKNIEGFEGLYSISDKGEVWSHWKNKLLSQKTQKNGYKMVALCLGDKKYKYFYVHRLVAIAFMENPENLPEVNHDDGCKSNNHVSNLEWCDKSSNAKHAIKNGLNVMSEDGKKRVSKHNQKIKDEDIPKIFKLRDEGLLMREIGEIYGVTKTQIGRILKGDRKFVGDSDVMV